jgi:hypothetical protein
MYNPERDFALVGVDLIRAAMSALEAQFHEPWFKQFMNTYSLTEADFAQAARPFAQAVSRVVDAPNPTEALQDSGFSDLPAPVQMAIYCKLGQVLLAAVWSGVKDVSKPESDPPLSVLEFIDDVEEMVAKFELR